MRSALITQSSRDQVFVTKSQSSLVALVVRDQPRVVLIARRRQTVISKPSPICVHVSRDRGSYVILAGQRGAAGQQGIPGPDGGSTIQKAAGEVLSALRVVYDLDDQVFVLDYRDANHIELLLGITITAGPIGQLLNIQRTGIIEDASWTWTRGRVWLGANGSLTQAAPSDGFDVLIGSATSATSITLNIQDPIELE
ncbi:MAG: hypothetical protein ACOH2R_08610 [Pseudomonas sp.]